MRRAIAEQPDMVDRSVNVASVDAEYRLRRAFAAAALAAIALTLVVITASAFIRHSQAGLSCANWPACYARVDGGAADVASLPGVEFARRIHRLAATGVAVVILALLLLAWTQRPFWNRERKYAFAALLVVGALGVLGIATSGARLPMIVLGNLLGGFLLLAVLTATFAVATIPGPAIDNRSRLLAVIALVLAFLETASGGMIGAQFASLACAELTNCGALSWQAFQDGGAWNPLRLPVAVNGYVAAPAGAAGLHVVHRALAIGFVVLGLVLAAVLRRARPQLAAAIGVLVVVEAGTGIAAAVSGPGLSTAIAHNAGAALLVALFASVAIRPPCAAS